MIMKKETLVFITSLAIIFIIGYINLSMEPENSFSDEDYVQLQDDETANEMENDIAEIVEGDPTDVLQSEVNETDYEILGDITDMSDINPMEASSDGVLNTLNDSFSSFKLNKEKGNMDILDHLEENLSNDTISDETKGQFEAMLLDKNEFIEAENDIELMLQSKGYNETVVIVDTENIKVVTNDTIEQADAVKILDVIVSETNYEPSQIKIVKFDNIDL